MSLEVADDPGVTQRARDPVLKPNMGRREGRRK